MLSTSEEFGLVNEASDSHEAVAQVERLEPDVVPMDLRMPGMSGLEAVAQLHEHRPPMPVVMLTTYNEDTLVIGGLQAGARAICSKTARWSPCCGRYTWRSAAKS